MITLLSHFSLGLLLGALCGVSISTKHLATSSFMRQIGIASGVTFMITALASKLFAEQAHSVELLADVVMGGIASALFLTLVSNNLSRVPKRLESRQGVKA